MAKYNKEAIVKAIRKQIEKGDSFATVLLLNSTKWKLARNTFVRYWKTAKEQHETLALKSKEATDKAYIGANVEAAKKAVMSSQERKEILTQIARGEIPLTKPMVVNQMLVHIDVVPDWMDRKAAIAELNKMDGEYAPTKVASTNKAGEDILPIPQIVVYNSAPPFANSEADVDRTKQDV